MQCSEKNIRKNILNILTRKNIRQSKLSGWFLSAIFIEKVRDSERNVLYLGTQNMVRDSGVRDSEQIYKASDCKC